MFEQMIGYIPLLNFVSLIASAILCWGFYLLSIMPATRAEKRGDQAWSECKQFRLISGIIGFIQIINVVLYIWFPLPLLDGFIYPNPLLPILVGFLIALVSTPIMLQGGRDAGKETWAPYKDTKMYGGIYKYIRHPQILGEMPLFVSISLWTNSFFLLIYMIVTVIILVPLMVYFEEKDLVKRFGKAYEDYKKRTGALFPYFRRST
ncbi:MAG: methyltransferase family protein [Candidatus Ranarchaeia archaeon]|jgi:protein-S-isoprenylcysteine O-methyltransferase Ste14